jgi:threonine synthase
MAPMKILHYHDTRDLDSSRPTFSEVVVRGIADGGGLYVPEYLPAFELEEILGLSRLPYGERAAFVFSRFGVDVAPERVAALMEEAYGTNFDDPRIAPVVEVLPGMHLLELWHGPTSAFKDMALQCMPVFFSEAVAAKRAAGGEEEEYLILVATSGDTGKAALEGYADRRYTRIAVFYPADGVSDMQRRQMVTQRGENVAVFGVRGNFDDCQNAVKAAFSDDAFSDELRRRWKTRLSSANSINWGRLLPQVVYYLSAYADLVAGGRLQAGDPMDVCVPTGNFGNILGAWYAKRIGTPIGRLICASNENNVLTDFIRTGVYDISRRPFVKTPSPSMDILISSNLERLLFELCRDGERVRGWIDDLARERRFEVDGETLGAIREDFVADYVTNDRSLETIRELFAETGCLIDPHTAVAWEVAGRLRGKAPLLVVATAHWAKFGADVYRALAGLAGGTTLPSGIEGKGGAGLLEAVQGMARGQKVPQSLTGLDRLEERFPDIVEGSKEGVEGALRPWLESGPGS